MEMISLWASKSRKGTGLTQEEAERLTVAILEIEDEVAEENADPDEIFEETLLRLTEKDPGKEPQFALFLDHFYDVMSNEEEI